MLASAATLGRHFDWHLLAAATGLDDTAVAEALEQAMGAQLVEVDGDGFHFRHTPTREAVLDTVLPPRRPAIAAAALTALDAAHAELRGQDRETAALAERAEQPKRAGALFHAIGVDALANGALARAAAALTRAARLLPSGDERTAASLALVDARARAGHVDDALAATRALVPDVRGDTGVAGFRAPRTPSSRLRRSPRHMICRSGTCVRSTSWARSPCLNAATRGCCSKPVMWLASSVRSPPPRFSTLSCARRVRSAVSRTR